MSAAHRHPPAFQITTGPQPLLQGLLALLAMLSAASLVAGLALHQPPLGWLALAVPGVGAAAWHLARIEPRQLQWDGQLWRLAPAGAPGPGEAVELAVLMDFGSGLLLRARVPRLRWPLWPRKTIYLWLTRRPLGADWGQLRATLFSARPQPVTSASTAR